MVSLLLILQASAISHSARYYIHVVQVLEYLSHCRLSKPTATHVCHGRDLHNVMLVWFLITHSDTKKPFLVSIQTLSRGPPEARQRLARNSPRGPPEARRKPRGLPEARWTVISRGPPEARCLSRTFLLYVAFHCCCCLHAERTTVSTCAPYECHAMGMGTLPETRSPWNGELEACQCGGRWHTCLLDE